MHTRFDQRLNVAERLRALPQAASEPEGWQAVQRKLAQRADQARRQARIAVWATAASVAALALFAGLRLLEPGPSTQSPAPRSRVAPAEVSDPMDELRARSRALEELLAGMPSRPAVERADTSLSIATLEAQVQWLDHELSLGDAEGAAAAEAERLWRDRVEVMNSLVQLRYVEAQRQVL